MPTQNTLLSIIIVSYNTKGLTEQTIASAYADINSSALLQDRSEIWVVDNHSTDGSVEMVRHLQKLYRSLHLITNTDNTGFATANNQALAQAQGKYLLLLNSDTIVARQALERMVQTFLKQPHNEETAVLEGTSQNIDRLGILSCQLLNPDGSQQPQGGSFPTLTSLAAHMLFLDDLPGIGRFFPSTQHTGRNQRQHHLTRLTPIDWVGGTAMMIKKAVLTEVGMLDQNIFMYGEDVEFCLRAKDHHWDVAILPTAHITHIGSASSSSKNAIIGELKSYLYIWYKHKPLWQAAIVRFLLRLGVHLRILLFGTIVKNATKVAVYTEALSALKK